MAGRTHRWVCRGVFVGGGGVECVASLQLSLLVVSVRGDCWNRVCMPSSVYVCVMTGVRGTQALQLGVEGCTLRWGAMVNESAQVSWRGGIDALGGQ